jgi:hypothetical protein
MMLGWFMSSIIVISWSITKVLLVRFCLPSCKRGTAADEWGYGKNFDGGELTSTTVFSDFYTRPEVPLPTNSPRVQSTMFLGSVGKSKATTPPAATFSKSQQVPRGAMYLMGGARGGLSDTTSILEKYKV